MISHHATHSPPSLASPDSADPQGQTVIDYRDPSLLAHRLEHAPEQFVLIDVRSPEEYRAGHIVGAINVPYRNIGWTMTKHDRAQAVVVYCEHGVRSAVAASWLRSIGCRDVHDFGGVSRWSGPLVQGG